MKLKNIGRAVLALAASAVCVFGTVSCTFSYTVGYLFLTGAEVGAGTASGQIGSYRIQNNNGQLRLTNMTSSGGFNPTQVVVNSTGTFLYVLNAGCGGQGQAACPATSGTLVSAQPSQIDLFSIGGRGIVTHQATFFPQGTNTRNIVLSGNFMYALDEFAGTTSTGIQTYGDITAFSVDSGTGRLTTIQNTQQKGSNGLPLNYFPVGTNPTWLAVSGGFAYAAEQGAGTPSDPSQAIYIYQQSATSGQLTQTQNVPTPTGAVQLTYVYASGTYLYALDAGTTAPLAQAGATGVPGTILPYSIATGGTLTAIAPVPNTAQGQSPIFPSRILKETTHSFLWVVNSGINTAQGATASVITAYFITANGQLTSANTGNLANGGNAITAGSGPNCIVEDPSNQYTYTTNFNDSTITAKKINQQTGGLDTLPVGAPAPPGSPTWCAVTGSTF